MRALGRGRRRRRAKHGRDIRRGFYPCANRTANLFESDGERPRARARSPAAALGFVRSLRYARYANESRYAFRVPRRFRSESFEKKERKREREGRENSEDRNEGERNKKEEEINVVNFSRRDIEFDSSRVLANTFCDSPGKTKFA